MRSVIKYVFFLALTPLFLNSCLRDTDLPDEPIIEFKNMEIVGDSVAYLNFSFTDGDGNFGLDQQDTLEPFVDLYKNNVIIDYYELQEGVWQRFGTDFPPTSPFRIFTTYSKRAAWIKPEGQNQTQDGEITIDMADYFQFTDYDTCRLEIFIVDRDLNHSNSIQTNSYLKP